MAKHDAFGREIGEDTLSEAGWRESTPATVTVETREAVAPEPVDPPVGPPSPAVRAARVRARVTKIVAISMLVALAVTGATVYMVFNAIRDGFEDGLAGVRVPDIETVLPQMPTETAVTPEVARGLQPRSLLRPERLAAALETLREAGGRALMLRLAPDRIDTQLRGAGTMRIVQIGPDGRLRQLVRTPAAAGGPGLDLARVDPGVPRRMLLAAERRFGLAPDDVDYVAVLDFGGDLSWNAFYDGGAAHVQAGPNGRITRRVS